MEEEIVYVVAPGVTLYIDDDNIYASGEVVRPEDFESLVEFRGLLAAGKIIEKQPEPPPPEPEKKWDGMTVDKALDSESVNPVENRAVAWAIEDIIAHGVEPIPLNDITELFKEE